jgi:hypothetical protein
MNRPLLSKSEIIVSPRGTLLLFLKKGGLTKIIKLKNRIK